MGLDACADADGVAVVEQVGLAGDDLDDGCGGGEPVGGVRCRSGDCDGDDAAGGPGVVLGLVGA